jgi:hypothetical protein
MMESDSPGVSKTPIVEDKPLAHVTLQQVLHVVLIAFVDFLDILLCKEGS